MSLIIYLHPHKANLGVLQLFSIKLSGKVVQSDNSAAELLREGRFFFFKCLDWEMLSWIVETERSSLHGN